MSDSPTRFRPFARMGSAGASYFRGAVAADKQSLNGPFVYPQILRVTHLGQVGTLLYRSDGVSIPLGSDGVASQAAYVMLAIPGAAVAVQSAYVTLAIPGAAVAVQSVYLALINTGATTRRRSQPLAGTL